MFEKIRAELRDKFDKMMKALYSRKGASLDISIVETDEVQDFISSHAAVLDSTFKKVKMSAKMRECLQNSDWIFSGMKTFHELHEAFPSLLDSNGDLKSFEQFLKDVQMIDDTYNANYLRSEYNFITASAQMAAQWERFEEDGDRYNLQYRTAGDERVRKSHKALEGITLPPSDPFWQQFYPPNGWGCRCGVVQVRKNKYPATSHDDAMKLGENATGDDKKKMFRFNSGIERKTVPDYNPYTITKCKTCPLTKDEDKNKLSKIIIPDNEMCAACRLLRELRKK